MPFLWRLGACFLTCGMLLGCTPLSSQNGSLQKTPLQKSALVGVSQKTVTGQGGQPQPQVSQAPIGTSKNTSPNIIYGTFNFLQNDPSASTHTPLCGVTRHQSIAIGVENYPQPLMTGDECVQNTCFDTQTGTYIAADGTYRVCR
ncbi:MAG: hypothetical protein IJ934_04405 [Acetobacter sp.]|nr:hypothetical protein [Acetobacter sp.]